MRQAVSSAVVKRLLAFCFNYDLEQGGLSTGKNWGDVVLNIPISATKVTFVMLFFMQLKYEGRIINISFLSTVGALAILIGFTFWDVAYR